MKHWIKSHRRHTAAIIALATSLAGFVMLLPKSPWTLIVGGLVMLIIVGISAIPGDYEAPR